MRPPLDVLVPSYVREFEPYIPSRPDPELMRMYGCSRLLRLNNNENPLGPPPGAQDVIRGFAPPRAAIYPSGDSFYLRQELAAHHGMDADQFLVGNGANEIITFVIKAFCQQGDNIVTADQTFAVYEWVAVFSGVTAKLIPLREHRFDGPAMVAAIDGRTKAIFLCNPNNPTGTYWDGPTLRSFLDAVDGRQIVVVDEAYFEFVENADYPNAMALIRTYPNLIVFRTFSKMYGMAGLRIGYLASSAEVVDTLRRTCVVYSVNSLAQEAAVAALRDDTGHVERTRALVREAKMFLRREFASMGLPVIGGEGNFLIVGLPGSDTLAYRRLMKEGVMVRAMTSFRFPNHIRISLSTMDAMEAAVAAVRKVLSS
jgi:histidinol-phosphate aminotransferase